MTQRPDLGIDSNCLTYLLEGIKNTVAPTDSMAAERIALLRTWLYAGPCFWLASPVVAEYEAIRDQAKRDLHATWHSVRFPSIKVQDPARVAARTNELSRLHSDRNDCQILAEAEDCRLSAVLTNDDRFHTRLGSTALVPLVKPIAFWESLKIPPGAAPVDRPRDDNPLSEQTWWRW